MTISNVVQGMQAAIKAVEANPDRTECLFRVLMAEHPALYRLFDAMMLAAWEGPHHIDAISTADMCVHAANEYLEFCQAHDAEARSADPYDKRYDMEAAE